MNDTNQKLCRGIADAEEQLADTPPILLDGGPYVFNSTKPVEAYLTDPAETVRMLKGLADWGVVRLLKVDDKEEWVCGVSVKDSYSRIHRHNFTGPSPEHAVAQAYLAMLLEQKK